MPENPVQNVTFPSNGRTAHGYLAVPESGAGPGVVVIQEWWGLTPHIAEVADRFAAEGYVALAPELGHFGDDDETTPPDAVQALAARIEAESGVTPQFHGYPAGHAFFNDSNPLTTYAPDEAATAWTRTLDFLNTHLR